MSKNIHVRFLGGTADGQGPTGSCLAIEINNGKKRQRYMIDAGLIQCRFRESQERNLEILKMIDPKTFDGIILTHAHIDHCGRIPLMVKNGFNGKIYCSQESAKLLPIMLEDNVKIQMSEASWRKKKMYYRPQEEHNSSRTWLGAYDKAREKEKILKKYEQLLSEPLYTLKDVERSLAMIAKDGFEYGQWIDIGDGIGLKLYRSGHVLGGAICVIRIASYDGFRYLGFSGDLGRDDGMILPKPETIDLPLDYWFCESTYGGRTHPSRKKEIDDFLSLIKRAVEEKGKIIIPSFALERTQEMIYLISKNIFSGNLPKIKIFLDSPMAEKITEVFAEVWDQSSTFKKQKDLKINPFDPWQNKLLKPVENGEESSALMEKRGPHIIIAGSGMCDAGRVRGHLRSSLSNPKTTVFLVGYMSEGSLGRKLKDGWPLVRMNGREIRIKADIRSFESFSAHADSPFLSEYTGRIIENNGPLKKIFLLHGETKSALDLKTEMIEKLPIKAENIVIPKIGQSFEL